MWNSAQLPFSAKQQSTCDCHKGIQRILHGRAGIRILSSSAESISHSFAELTRERYFQLESERK